MATATSISLGTNYPRRRRRSTSTQGHVACRAETQAPKARERRLERETGIEPATNSLEGCDSTTELLPPTLDEPEPTTSPSSRSQSVCPTGHGLGRRSQSARPADKGGTMPAPAILPGRPGPSRPPQSFAAHPVAGLVSPAVAESSGPRGVPTEVTASVLANRAPKSGRRACQPKSDVARSATTHEGWWRGKDSNLRRRLADRFTVCCV